MSVQGPAGSSEMRPRNWKKVERFDRVKCRSGGGTVHASELLKREFRQLVKREREKVLGLKVGFKYFYYYFYIFWAVLCCVSFPVFSKQNVFKTKKV